MNKPLKNCLLVSDIDGTLIGRDFIIPEANKAAIEKFTQLGGHFTLASGRSFSATMIFAKKINATCPIISYNGAAIFDMKSESIVWQLHLPESAKNIVYDIMNRFPQIGVEIHSEGKLYVVQDSPETEIHLSDESLAFERMRFEDLPNVKWSKILYATSGENLQKLQEYAASIDCLGAYHVRTSPIYFEMIPENANKGTALRELSKYMNIDMQNVYAIGDYYNDVEMLKAAGYSAVASNAPEELHRFADFISVSNTEGAVAAFIEHIIQSRN